MKQTASLSNEQKTRVKLISEINVYICNVINQPGEYTRKTANLSIVANLVLMNG